MSLAVCITCGAIKRRPIDRCPVCGAKPQTDADKAKALILSLDYEIDGVYRGKTKEELEAIAAGIRAGTPYAFDPAEVEAVIAYAHSVLGTPPRVLIRDAIRWILPAIVLLATLYYIAFMK